MNICVSGQEPRESLGLFTDFTNGNDAIVLVFNLLLVTIIINSLS